MADGMWYIWSGTFLHCKYYCFSLILKKESAWLLVHTPNNLHSKFNMEMSFAFKPVRSRKLGKRGSHSLIVGCLGNDWSKGTLNFKIICTVRLPIFSLFFLNESRLGADIYHGMAF